MNRTFIMLAVCLAGILPATKAAAQLTSMTYRAAPAIQPPDSVSEAVAKNAPIYPVALSDRAEKNFRKRYANVVDVTWTESKTGFAARFMLDGILHRAFLSKRGNWEGTIRYYTEQELPGAIRQQIKSGYCAFTITGVTEVQMDTNTAYLVSIADKTTWKIIRVLDGELNVWQAYAKG